jgi:asparagine synthase (glutamine-hydrolysing)
MSAYFDQKYIRRILELDRSGQEQYRRQIYLLVSLELWHRTFMRSSIARRDSSPLAVSLFS